jgi:hypothetical protein
MLYALVLDTVSRDYSQMPEAEATALAARYNGWMERVREGGRLVSSLYLESTPSTRGVEAVSGIMVVRAGSRSEVDAIIADSPHVERCGHISVRRVVADE